MRSENKQLTEENSLLKRSLAEQQERIMVLENQIAWLKQRLFGSGNSEKLQNNAQMLLQLEELQEQEKAIAREKETITYERDKPQKKKPRESTEEHFANLPVKDTVEIIPDEVNANPEAYERVGEEVTFEVDIDAPKLYKRMIIRPKFRYIGDRNRPLTIAPAPARPVNGGYASAGLLSWIVVNKYLNHLPLYRQEKMSRHWGAVLSRKTMSDWVETVAEWLKPIYNHMREQLLEGDYLQADETPIRYQDPDINKSKTEQGQLWVIGRPGSDVVFDWRLSRKHSELFDILKGYRGVLQSDGYDAYRSYTQKEGAQWVGCWAHARRKFFESIKEDPAGCGLVLRLIGQLYALEKQWDNDPVAADPKIRAHLRRRDFTLTLSLLKKVTLLIARRSRPKSGPGKASRYLLTHWGCLSAHLEHGQTKLDNNLIENAIRPSALGKKNWLFIGHPDAGQKSAVIYSIIVSCERHKKDPLLYIKDVLTKLPAMTNQQDLTSLCPKNWKPTQVG